MIYIIRGILRHFRSIISRPLLSVAREITYAVICSGSCEPGESLEVGGIDVLAKSWDWGAVDADAYDWHISTLKLLCMIPTVESRAIREAIAELDRNRLGEGWGPVAPCFDEFDRDTEARRGRWYVLDGKALDHLNDVLRFGQPWSLPGTTQLKSWLPSAITGLAETCKGIPSTGDFDPIAESYRLDLPYLERIAICVLPERREVSLVLELYCGGTRRDVLHVASSKRDEILKALRELSIDHLVEKIEQWLRLRLNENPPAPFAESPIRQRVIAWLDAILPELIARGQAEIPDDGYFTPIEAAFDIEVAGLGIIRIALLPRRHDADTITCYLGPSNADCRLLGSGSKATVLRALREATPEGLALELDELAAKMRLAARPEKTTAVSRKMPHANERQEIVRWFHDAVPRLIERARLEVPEVGEFPVVQEQHQVGLAELQSVTLRIECLPLCVRGEKRLRSLELEGGVGTIMLLNGEKQALLDSLDHLAVDWFIGLVDQLYFLEPD